MLYRSHNRKEAELLRPFIGLKPMGGLTSPGSTLSTQQSKGDYTLQAFYRAKTDGKAQIPQRFIDSTIEREASFLRPFIGIQPKGQLQSPKKTLLPSFYQSLQLEGGDNFS